MSIELEQGLKAFDAPMQEAGVVPDARFGFGKHCRKMIKTVRRIAPDYLVWLAAQDWFKEKCKGLVKVDRNWTAEKRTEASERAVLRPGAKAVARSLPLVKRSRSLMRESSSASRRGTCRVNASLEREGPGGAQP
jgi:hypothetical protein